MTKAKTAEAAPERRVNARPFRELSAKLDAVPGIEKLRAEADAEFTRELVEYSLGELRQHLGITQTILAERLGIKQPSISSLERQDDMMLSTLRNVVHALGGHLQISVTFPSDTGAETLTVGLGTPG